MVHFYVATGANEGFPPRQNQILNVHLWGREIPKLTLNFPELKIPKSHTRKGFIHHLAWDGRDYSDEQVSSAAIKVM